MASRRMQSKSVQSKSVQSKSVQLRLVVSNGVPRCQQTVGCSEDDPVTRTDSTASTQSWRQLSDVVGSLLKDLDPAAVRTKPAGSLPLQQTIREKR